MPEPNLNETIELYKPFPGRNVEQMPLLIAEGRVPISMYGVLQRRTDKTLTEKARSWWFNNYIDSGDADAVHPNGKHKLVHDAQLLRELTAKSQLVNGGLVLEDGVYESLDGEEFTPAQIERYTGSDLTIEQTKANPFWQRFARNDLDLLNEYASKVFERTGNSESMGVFPSAKEKVPIMRSWYADWVDDRCGTFGYYDLGYAGGRLVGVAPQALVRSYSAEAPLESVVVEALKDKREFRFNGSIWAPLADTVTFH